LQDELRLKPRFIARSSLGRGTRREATMYWGHGLGVATGVIWIAVVGYLLTLAHRLVRAIERIADKWVSKP
jgi:hypothetical protein